MQGNQFRLYFAYDTVHPADPKSVDTLVNADGTDAGPGTVSINDLISSAWLKLADEVKNVTVDGNPNQLDTTTRAVARQGFRSSEITTIDWSMNCQVVYEPLTAFQSDKAGFEIASILEFCQETKTPIFAIDLDKALSADGSKGVGANYTVGISSPREVEGHVIYDVTLGLKNFAQRVVYNPSASPAGYVAATGVSP